MSLAIEVENLTKEYRPYPGPRAFLRDLFLSRKPATVIRALKDVSFAINEGEAFGVVGENGAGKSTLLKILTGTAYPTRGRVEVNGEASALLELGAGFHPEFTGRQNIYFSGALMGIAPERIREAEPAILDFCELDEFIDQQVKTYSTGMYLRLGFAIATGFDSAILIIDEALAVGDQRFQKKCTDRILDFKKSGKTILFCSHNLYQVRSLCDRTIWLRRGVAEAIGASSDVVDEFTSYLRGRSADDARPARPNEVCYIESVRLQDDSGRNGVDVLRPGGTLRVEVISHFSREFKGLPSVGIAIVRNDDTLVYATSSSLDGVELDPVSQEKYRCCLELPDLALLSGRYYVSAFTTDQSHLQAYHAMEKAVSFKVAGNHADVGITRLTHRWI